MKRHGLETQIFSHSYWCLNEILSLFFCLALSGHLSAVKTSFNLFYIIYPNHGCTCSVQTKGFGTGSAASSFAQRDRARCYGALNRLLRGLPELMSWLKISQLLPNQSHF